MAKLLPDSSHTLNIDPVLASRIGLNEAILLHQLHFVLTTKDDDKRYLKTIDNARWYRESPREWVVHHFQFWDENVVKRAMANLRKDGLVLARSDLNEYGTKDRSLWYSINYPALERLDGPVKRLEEKQEKRRKARRVRTENEAQQGEDSSNEYTKVQNVLLINEGSKVQNVEDDKSTKCTPEPVQNVLLTKVQNVPTPKEVIPKEIIKESGGKPPKQYTPRQKLMFALASVCRIDLKVATDKTWGQLKQTAKNLEKAKHTPEQIDAFGEWWFQYDWRGEQDQPPIPSQVLETWGNYEHWLQKGQSNGRRQPGSNQRTNQTGQGQPRSTLDDQPTVNPYTGETIPAPS